MLTSWLQCANREATYDGFTVADSTHQEPPNSAIKEHLKELMVNARLDPDFVRLAAEEFGWNRVRELVTDAFPKSLQTKRGFFGEVLGCALLEQFYGYEIPIQKLRYAIVGDQTLPGTDALALKADGEGSISELSFVECKFRGRTDTGAAVQAYGQLKSDTDKRVPDLLRFTAERMTENGHPLAGPMRRFMRDRTGRDERDTFQICLSWDRAMWSERVVDNLNENEVELTPLTVHVVHLEELVSLTDELFAAIGIENISEDDD